MPGGGGGGGGGARGQNLEHLRFFFVSFFSCRKLFNLYLSPSYYLGLTLSVT